MEITEKKQGNINIISVTGRLDAYSSIELEKKLDSLLDAVHVQQVINLEKLEYISSSGLRIFLATLKKAKKQQGDIKLACLKPFIKEVFDISGFTQLFSIFATEEADIAAFKSSS
jgi:anti-sigma B factor antagonist